MLSESMFQQLRAENELLQLQLQDANEIMMAREEELRILRKTAKQTVELQSQLDINLDEFYQMQDQIGNERQRADSAIRRELSLEQELLQSIDMEKNFYNLRDELRSTKAAFGDASDELSKMSLMHRKISDLSARIAELESQVEIANLENGFLREEVQEYRKGKSVQNKN